MLAEREENPRPIHSIPYELRKRMHARWESRPTTIGGSDAKPHVWDCKATDQDHGEDEFDDYQADYSVDHTCSWAQTWPQLGDSGGRPQLLEVVLVWVVMASFFLSSTTASRHGGCEHIAHKLAN